MKVYLLTKTDNDYNASPVTIGIYLMEDKANEDCFIYQERATRGKYKLANYNVSEEEVIE